MHAGASFLLDHIRAIPDWPREGVTFRDITPLLADSRAYRFTVDALAEPHDGTRIDRVVGVEARGFLFASPIAYRFEAGLVPVRKAGKLPWEIEREEYALEYGVDLLEIHRDGILPGERVLVVDDVLATGGTAAATARLVERLGGEIAGFVFVIELEALGGREQIDGYDVRSLVSYA